MTIKRGQSRKRLYGLTAITLSLCISISAITYLIATSLLMKQTFTEQTEQSAIDQITNNSGKSSETSNQNTSITTKQQNTSLSIKEYHPSIPIKEQPSQNTSTSQEAKNVTLIPEEEALKLAMSYIQSYASENNRTIASVNATFYNQIRAWNSLRGNTSESYPEWSVLADFVRVDDWNNPEHWIVGYSVLIWADTAEIYSAHVQGIM